MKVEIEIPDLEGIYYCNGEVRGKEFKEAIIEVAIEKFIDRMYDNYINNKVYSTVADEAKEIIQNHSNEIIDKVINRVSDEIVKKKTIKNEMPRKSEITNINKEWENYFMELIDKAIAKKFK